MRQGLPGNTVRAKRQQWFFRPMLFFAQALLCALSSLAAEPKPATLDAFGRYVKLTEARMETERSGKHFLWFDSHGGPRPQDVRSRLRGGEILAEHMETQDNGKEVPIPDGLIHHWVATCFVPGVTLAQARGLLEDFERQPEIYKPDVQRSKILRAGENDYDVAMRLYKKSMVTVVYNAQFHVRYFPLGATRGYSTSYSTRIVEVDHPGEPNEQERPSAKDHGYLWRLYSYWRFEERDGGVYLEVEIMGLSRGVPFLLGWLVNPIIKKIPREYLSHTLDQTRKALLDPKFAKPAAPRAAQE